MLLRKGPGFASYACFARPSDNVTFCKGPGFASYACFARPPDNVITFVRPMRSSALRAPSRGHSSLRSHLPAPAQYGPFRACTSGFQFTPASRLKLTNNPDVMLCKTALRIRLIVVMLRRGARPCASAARDFGA